MIKKLLGFGLACFFAAPLAWAGPEDVKFPADYQTAFINYLSMDRTANDKQIIRIFANSIALEGAQKDGELPYGSILVGELYKVKVNEGGEVIESSLGRRIRDKLAAIVVMEKGKGWGDAYPDALKVGDWEFAVFSPDGKFLKKDYNTCRECHAPLEETKFLFSYEHLRN